MTPCAGGGNSLSASRQTGSFEGMQAFGRFLQFAGLTIPPLAMIAQLGDHISAGKMLQFLLVSVGVFVLGYTMQRFSK